MPRENSPKPGTVSDVLAGLLVLVVEDQSLIALDTESMLADLGASSVASFTSADACARVAPVRRTGSRRSRRQSRRHVLVSVADELSQRGIPFAFTTGYDDTVMIPSRFAHVPVVQKPYTPDSLRTGACDLPQAAGSAA